MNEATRAGQVIGTFPQSTGLKLNSVALALSGGAAHGDFEVGVVQYLYNRRNIKPAIICGTSVGAIAALKLAEGEPDKPATPDAQGHLQGLAGLEKVWKSLRVDGDMYTERDLFSKLEDDAKSLLKNAGITILSLTPFGFGPFGFFAGLLSSGGDLEKLGSDLKQLLATRSLATLDPIFKVMRDPATLSREQVEASNIAMRLATVALDDGLLRYVKENGDVLERDGQPTLCAPEYDQNCAGPLLGQIADIDGQIKDLQDMLNPQPDDPGSPRGPGAKGGGLGERIQDLYHQRDALEEKLAACPKTQKPLNVALVDGALASSSLPFIFPPVNLGDYWYVDGGIRMVTPIEPAINLGASIVYAVVCSQEKSTRGVDFLTNTNLSSYAPPANFLDVGLRAATDIEPGEINDDQLYPPQGWGKPVVVIRSEYDIHDSMTIDPGLIRIRMDHGFMRADDTLQAYDKDASNYRSVTSRYSRDRNTTLIVRTRKMIWVTEFAANGHNYRTDGTGKPITPTKLTDSNEIAKALESVRYWKRELKDMVDERTKAGGAIPDDAEQWWMDWEAHSFELTQQLWNSEIPFVPLKKMTVSATPSSLDVNKPVTFTVTALDEDHHALDDVDIRADGVTIGVAGHPITHTFAGKKTDTIDPVTHLKMVHLDAPAVTAYKSGYYVTTVDVIFTGFPN